MWKKHVFAVAPFPSADRSLHTGLQLGVVFLYPPRYFSVFCVSCIRSIGCRESASISCSCPRPISLSLYFYFVLVLCFLYLCVVPFATQVPCYRSARCALFLRIGIVFLVLTFWRGGPRSGVGFFRPARVGGKNCTERETFVPHQYLFRVLVVRTVVENEPLRGVFPFCAS